MSSALRLSPVILQGDPALLVSGSAADVAALVAGLPGALDHDLAHRSGEPGDQGQPWGRGQCRVWAVDVDAGAAELLDAVREAATVARVDVVLPSVAQCERCFASCSDEGSADELADTERPAPPASGWTISDDPGRDCLGLAVHGRAAAEEP